MDRLITVFERLAVGALMVMLLVAIVYGTAMLALSQIQDFSHISMRTADQKALFDLFGLFVAVLVGIELLKIMKHLVSAHEINTALVVQTALIALCNKIISLSVADTPWGTLVAIAALVVALAAANLSLRFAAAADAESAG